VSDNRAKVEARISDDGNEIALPIFAIFDALPESVRSALAEQLALEPAVTKAVAELILTGFTPEHGYWTMTTGTGGTELDKVREEVVTRLNEAAGRAIARLLRAVDSVNAELKRKEEWAWSMYHAWPRDREQGRPELAPFVAASFATDERIAEELAKDAS